MRQNKIIIFVIICITFIVQVQLYAWWPIAHYVIAKKVAQKKGLPESVADYANLPDYVDSSEPYWVVARRVGYYFIWSHGVIDNGNNYLVPKKPSYPEPDDARYPGIVMRELLKYKLKPGKISKKELLDMQNTVNGFRIHNAADRVVHWDFFLGGTAEKWVVHHGLKEGLADYNILLNYGYGGGDYNKMFTKKGYINLKNLNTSVIPKSGPGFKGNAKLMHFAQKVYRKNRRVMRRGKKTVFDVQSVSKIKKCLKDQNVNWFKKHVWADAWPAAPLSPPGPIFTIKEYDKKTGKYKTKVVFAVKPSNNRDEYLKFLDYQIYLLQNFKTPKYPEGTQLFGNEDESDDWKVWDDNKMRELFDESVKNAEKWMFDLNDLTPEK